MKIIHESRDLNDGPKRAPQHPLNNELRYAAHSGDLARVRDLIDRGADPNHHNQATLFLASNKGHLAVVQYLIDQGGSFVVGLRAAEQYDQMDILHWLKGAQEAQALHREAKGCPLTINKRL